MIPLVYSDRDDRIYITGSVLLLSFPSNKLGKYISQELTLLKYHIVTQRGWFFLQGKKNFHIFYYCKRKSKSVRISWSPHKSFSESLTVLHCYNLLRSNRIRVKCIMGPCFLGDQRNGSHNEQCADVKQQHATRGLLHFNFLDSMMGTFWNVDTPDTPISY